MNSFGSCGHVHPSPVCRSNHTQTAYVFDLDDVLLQTSRLFSQPHVRNWIETHARTNDEAHTVAGYRQVIQPDSRLHHQLQQLQGHKFILTNASREHAHASLHALGIVKNFIGQIDATHDMALKPHNEPYYHMNTFVQNVCADRNQSPPHRVVFFDDRIENHQEPKRMGWTTVWVYGAIDSCERSNMLHQVPEYVDMSFATIHDALDYFVATQNYQPNLLPMCY